MGDAPPADLDDVAAEPTGGRRRVDAARGVAKARIVTLARAILPVSDGVSDALVDELSDQAGISPRTFRMLFPTNDDLLRAVNEQLVEDCASRLAGAAERVERTSGASEADELVSAAIALAEAWPMDWASLSIRARERANALSTGAGLTAVLEAERRFVPALLDGFLAMMARLDRRFVWEPVLATRVVILAYERSFEAWVMSGGDERTFSTSPFVRQTLPAILAGVSAPAAG